MQIEAKLKSSLKSIVQNWSQSGLKGLTIISSYFKTQNFKKRAFIYDGSPP